MSFASQNCDTFAIVPTTPDPADAPAAGETGGPVTDSPCGRCQHRTSAHMVLGALYTGPCRAIGCNCQNPTAVTEPACPFAPDCTDPDHAMPVDPDDEPELDAHTLRALGINR